jgi:hypothetical protein
VDNQQIEEVDLNPVMFAGRLPLAVDALMVMQKRKVPGDGP